MIIVSDVVTVRERGKYLTLLGIGIAGGSGELHIASVKTICRTDVLSVGVGPFIGALLAEKAKWNWVFWMMAPSRSRVTSGSCLTTDRLNYSGRSDHGAHTVHSTSKAVNGQFEGEAATYGLARKPPELDHDRLHSGECTYNGCLLLSSPRFHSAVADQPSRGNLLLLSPCSSLEDWLWRHLYGWKPRLPGCP